MSLAFNVTWGPGVANAPAGFKSVVQAALQYFRSVVANPITINLTIDWAAGAPGTSQTQQLQYTYDQVRAALIAANAPGCGTLPTTDPTNGGQFYVSGCLAQALGLTTGTFGGQVIIGSGYQYSYTPGTAAAGQIDLYGVLCHEISEVMGRVVYLNQPFCSTLDLYDWASPGVRATSTSAARYFSIDNGRTNLNQFNVNPSGDWGDLSMPANAFNAFVSAGQVEAMTANDLTMMAAMGWSLAGAPPPPPGPSITSVSEVYNAASGSIRFELVMSAPVTLTWDGVPQYPIAPGITLNNGAVISMSGNGGNGLYFVHNLMAGESPYGLLVTAANPNHTAIKDAAGNIANLSLAGVPQNPLAGKLSQ